LHFLAQESPQSYGDVLMIPLILTFIGAFVYFLGWNKERNGGGSTMKWIGLFPLLLAIILGFKDVQNAMDPFVKSDMRGKRKLYYSQFLSPGLPFVTMLGLLGWHFYEKGSKKGTSIQTEADVQSSPT